jgi:hypothetical protein
MAGEDNLDMVRSNWEVRLTDELKSCLWMNILQSTFGRERTVE